MWTNVIIIEIIITIQWSIGNIVIVFVSLLFNMSMTALLYVIWLCSKYSWQVIILKCSLELSFYFLFIATQSCILQIEAVLTAQRIFELMYQSWEPIVLDWFLIINLFQLVFVLYSYVLYFFFMIVQSMFFSSSLFLYGFLMQPLCAHLVLVWHPSFSTVVNVLFVLIPNAAHHCSPFHKASYNWCLHAPLQCFNVNGLCMIGIISY